jgi:uncharacterized protein (TIGR03435 family)
MEFTTMRLFAFFALLCSAAFAQTDDAAFEAASIKPYPVGQPVQFSGCMGGPGTDNPGQIHCEYMNLRSLVMRAYEVKNQQVFGPSWMETEKFNILAKIPAGATRKQVAAMFRNLLVTRFKLEAHHETRPLSGYAITVAKSGPKIKETPDTPPAADEPPPGGKLPTDQDGFPILRASTIASGPVTLFRNGRARMQGRNTTMAMLADFLSGHLDRVVTDETGLTGKYDVTMNWTPDAGPGPGADVAGPPDLFAAIEQQLGLKLLAKKVDRDTIVIDRAEKVPTEN